MKKVIITSLILIILPSLAHASIDINLKYGSRGTEVLELQEFLISKGYLHGTATGNFFSLTRAAIISYQKAKNIIPALGFVGLITRGKINTELAVDDSQEIVETGTTTPPTKQNSTNDLLKQQNELLKQQLQAQQQIIQNTTKPVEPLPVPPQSIPIILKSKEEAINQLCIIKNKDGYYEKRGVAYNYLDTRNGIWYPLGYINLKSDSTGYKKIIVSYNLETNTHEGFINIDGSLSNRLDEGIKDVEILYNTEAGHITFWAQDIKEPNTSTLTINSIKYDGKEITGFPIAFNPIKVTWCDEASTEN